MLFWSASARRMRLARRGFSGREQHLAAWKASCRARRDRARSSSPKTSVVALSWSAAPTARRAIGLSRPLRAKPLRRAASSSSIDRLQRGKGGIDISSAARRDGNSKVEKEVVCRHSDGKRKASSAEEKGKNNKQPLLLLLLSLNSSQLTCSPFLELARATTRATGRAVKDCVRVFLELRGRRR